MRKQDYTIAIGYNLLLQNDTINIDLEKTGHMCIAGGSGSGKSMLQLYILYKLSSISPPIDLYIGDFKRSGDYKGVVNEDKFYEYDKVINLIDQFYEEFENTPEDNQTLKILLIDEYAGFIIWLMQNDKKKAEEIKSKISSILMLGRSRKCFVWIVLQRISAQLFPSGIGAIDNFQVLIGLGKLTMESHKSLFGSEHLDNDQDLDMIYHRTGSGLCLIDGQPLCAIQVPLISDKHKLKRLICKKFEEKRTREQ